MASPIEAQLILCDAAQPGPGSKLHMLGAGWSATPTPTPPHAVAVLLKVPWDRANQKIALKLQLFSEDGEPVVMPIMSAAAAASGDRQYQPIKVEAELEVGRPAGIAPGSMLDQSFCLNVAPMPIAPGRYEWRLVVGDAHVTTSFQVMKSRVPRV